MGGDERAAEQRKAEALDAYVERLLADSAAEVPAGVDREELRAYLLAAALAGRRAGSTEMPRDARARLLARIDQAMAPAPPQPAAPAPRRRVSRREGLVAAAGLAAATLVGVAVDRTISGLETPKAAQPDLIGSRGRWYDVAEETALAPGDVRRFTAGGIDGFLLNEHGRVSALSAICTHMGCHLNWSQAQNRFECLCHWAAFNRYGRPEPGLTLAALPPINVRVHGGRIYVWGTMAESWG